MAVDDADRERLERRLEEERVRTIRLLADRRAPRLAHHGAGGYWRGAARFRGIESGYEAFRHP